MNPQEPLPLNSLPSKLTIYGSLGGAIFGSLCWLAVMTIVCKDWPALVLVTIAALALFIWATRSILSGKMHYWPVAKWSLAGIVAINLAMVNLRWNHWLEIYRQSQWYDPNNDLSLRAVNLIILMIGALLWLQFTWLGYSQRKK